nr:type III-A CRISPR-associated RAMP protein Csm5 [Bacteroidota bacterium]
MNNCKIETITPVHIGSGVEFQKNTEFLNQGEQVGIIDEKKVLDIIGTENIGQWVSIIEKGKPLLDYLELRKPGIQISEVCSRVMDVYCESIANVKSLKEQLHNGTAKPYIPGSSLKGAIRTAIFTSLVNRLSGIPDSDFFNRKKQLDDSWISKKLFGKDPNHDSLRFLHVGDVMFEKHSTLAMNVMSMNYMHRDISLNKSVGQLTEAIGSGMESDFKLAIDQIKLKENLMRKNIHTDIHFLDSYETLLTIINKHTIKLLQEEIELWDEYKNYQVVDEYLKNLSGILDAARDYKANEALLRLGHGSGWTFMTGNWAKKNMHLVPDEIWGKIVNKARPGNMRKYADYDMFPKSRRMDEDGDLLGFVKLKYLGDIPK